MDLWLPNRLYMLHMWSSESEAGAPLSWRPDPISAMLVNRGLPPRAAPKIPLGFIPAWNKFFRIKQLLDTVKKIRFSSENQVFAKMLKIQLQLPYIPL